MPREDSNGEDNGQITIVGGSELFTGAPLLSLTAASRMVDMVFLATPGEDRETAHKVALFSKLKSVIWVPRGDLDKYIEKSDAVLIGPGMMRYSQEGAVGTGEVLDVAGTETKMLTHYLLKKYPKKRWVIDGGSLQVMSTSFIPQGSILTTNHKEFALLFGEAHGVEDVAKAAHTYGCIIVYKGAVSWVSDGETTFEVNGGNAGLTKGGTGDVLAGITAGLAAKNDPLLSAACANWLVKRTAEVLYDRVGYHFNSDDLADSIFEVWNEEMKLNG